MGRPSLRFAPLRSVVLALAIATSACEKKAPPDPRVLQGYALLRTDAAAALREFEGAREPERIDALLGRGLALEGLRRYGDAKEVLARGAKTGDADVLFALTRVELMLGDADAARVLIDQVLGKSSTNRSVLLLEGILAHDPARARTSLGHLNAWLETLRSSSAPPELAPAEFHLIRAGLHAQLGDAEARSRDVASARKRWFTSAEDALSLAVLATAATKADLAASFLEKLLTGELTERQRLQAAELAFRLGRLALTRDALLALPSGTPETLQLRARYDFATKAPTAATSLARALTSTERPEMRLEFGLALAETHLREGRIDDARKATESLLAERPEARGAQLVLARIDLAAGHTEAALARLEPLLAAHPPTGVREIAALAYVGARRGAEARPLLLQLLEEDPSHNLAARLLIAIELESGKSKELVGSITELVRRAPNDLTLRLLWVDLLRKLEPARVAEALRESVERSPTEARLWMELYRHHEGRKEKTEARAALEEGHRRNPENPLLAAALAATLTGSGRRAEAAALYEIVLRHSEKNVVALNNLALFHVDELGDVPKGVELAEKAHRLAPDEPAVADTLGWALYRRGTPDDLKRAEELFESARSRLASPTFHYHFGATLLALGKHEPAKLLLRRALQGREPFPESAEAKRLLDQGT